MVFMDLFSLLEYCMPLLFTMAFAWLMGLFSNIILPFYQLGFLFSPTQFSLFANTVFPFGQLGSPFSPTLLHSQGSFHFFYLLTNTLSSHDLFPPPFHHMTLSPDRLPIVLTM